MAPLTGLVQGLLSKRQSNEGNGFNNNSTKYCGIYGCYSTWDSWGRWVALVVVVVVLLLLALLFSCFSNRRRRQRGQTPMYGTGWLPTYNQSQSQANKNPGGYYAPPPPPYMGHQQTGNTFHSNEGYYGNHGNVQPQNEFELQQPSSSYQPPMRGMGGDEVYGAPTGPPPPKNGGAYTYTSPDGILR